MVLTKSAAKTIQKDYELLLRNNVLVARQEISNLLLMQSILGHAQNAHSVFKKRLPDITMDDIVEALDYKVKELWHNENIVDAREFIKNKRQQIIDAIYEWVDLAIQQKQPKALVDKSGRALAGLDGLDKELIEVNNVDTLLIGILLGSKMDNYEWRTKVRDRYGIELGGGACYAVNLDVVRRKGLTLEKLATMEWNEHEIERFKKDNLIVGNGKKKIKSSDSIKCAYIRRKKGRGVSDDCAILIAGMLYGYDAALGVFLADAIDTWDKYTPYIIGNGQDEMLGDFIEKHGIMVDEQKIIEFIYLAAIPQGKKLPDSSQRYLLQRTKTRKGRLRISAIESHLRFLRGERVERIKIGWFEESNRELYAYIKGRISTYKEI